MRTMLTVLPLISSMTMYNGKATHAFLKIDDYEDYFYSMKNLSGWIDTNTICSNYLALILQFMSSKEFDMQTWPSKFMCHSIKWNIKTFHIKNLY